MRPRLYQLAALAGMTFPITAQGLEPADIAVIFNTKSPVSLRIAQYYMGARKIPPNHLIALTCDAAENIPEEAYRTSVVPQLLKALGERKLLPDAATGAAGVKCLVSTFDVPLKILARRPNAAETVEIAGMQSDLDQVVAQLAKDVGLYNQIGLPQAATAPTPPATSPAKPTLPQVTADLNAAIVAAGQRLEKLHPPDKEPATLKFIQLQSQVGGMAVLLSTLSVAPDAPNADAGRQKLVDLSIELQGLREQFNALAKQRDNPRMRKEMVDVRQKAEGLLGRARMLDETINYLKPDATEACFDSELTLLLADQNYSRTNWVTNPKNLEAYPSFRRAALTPSLPTLMVSRLDGSTPAKAQELIDIAIQTEAAGLEGKLYLDARGLHGTDAYSIYDADIRRAADWMKQHSTMETILDDNDALLAAKDAPDAALYCGWYSLRNYQDSCQWVKGAVGYHVASLEMLSLHDPHETGWTVNLLNRGFAGTLGATDEPYLSSFPKPSLFFPLLLSGEFTQGEVWQLTAPMLSWRVGWVGDPLYNPFKVKPRVKVEDLLAHPVLRNAFAILNRDVPAPATTTGRAN